MIKARGNRYKEIYQKKVLPKKSVTKGTPESYKDTVELYKDFCPYLKRANEVVLGGEPVDQKR